jgi:pseudouridine synthase
MRLNQFIAAASGLSRRSADLAIAQDRVHMNGRPAEIGQQVRSGDHVTLDGQDLRLPNQKTILLLNKPVGYVCSRDGQGSRTIYDLLPADYHNLKPVGRLDKDSSGLLLLTDEGNLANELTHPRYAKEKIYEITLDKPFSVTDKDAIEHGVKVENYLSRLVLSEIKNPQWRVIMTQGRNRQIRRTFAALGYDVMALHRTAFGPYKLETLQSGQWKLLKFNK